MPVFDIQDASGKSYEVEAPDMDAALAAIGMGSATSAPKVEQPVSTTEDALKAGGIGLAQGAIGLATLPGNIQKLMQAGWNKVAPEALKAETLPGTLQLPTASDVQSRIEESTGEFYKPKTAVGEYARTVGEFAPGVLFPGTATQKLALNWLGPAVGSETAGQITKGKPSEPYARLAGGLAGSVAPAAAMRVVTPFPAASAERTRQANILLAEGVDNLTAGQATGSRPLQWMESVAADSPISAGRARHMSETQGEQFTRAALRRVGENAPRATPEVIDAAFTRVGQQFDDLIARNRLRLDPQLNGDLMNVAGQYYSVVNPSARAPIVERTINEIRNSWAGTGGRVGAPGIMDGDVYQSLRSRLDRAARGTNDPQLQDALFGIRNALDDAMERGMTAADTAAWREARNQYRNLLVIERAATGAGENAAAGIISPAQLRGAAVGQNRRSYARGQGDFDELARAGVATMTPLPNSGTPARLAAQGALSAVGAVGGAATGGAPGAAAGAITGVLGPGLAGRALLSAPAQRFLRNQVMAPIQRETNVGAGMVAQGPSDLASSEQSRGSAVERLHSSIQAAQSDIKRLQKSGSQEELRKARERLADLLPKGADTSATKSWTLEEAAKAFEARRRQGSN